MSKQPVPWLMPLDDLKEKISTLKKENLKLENEISFMNTQLKYSECTSSVYQKEKKLTVGQLTIYTSSLETMRAIFLKYEETKFEEPGYISIYKVPEICPSLGENITEKDSKNIIEELKSTVAKENFVKKSLIDVINFDQFLEWWRKRYQKDGTFNLISVNLKKMGKFIIKNVKVKQFGKIDTLAFRARFYYKLQYEEKAISPWHDIPLWSVGQGLNAKLLHYINLIPKWTRAKMITSKRELYNPIKQMVKYGKLRYYKHGDMMFNYGMFPQTWEDCTKNAIETNKKGDNDPLSAIELGTKQLKIGEISVVKVLGVLGLIDKRENEEETDWKVIVISIDDPLSNRLQDIDDVETFIPGAISSIREYFRSYKVCTGHKPNTFIYGEMPKGSKFATSIVNRSHQFWKGLQENGSVTPMINEE